MEFFKPGLRIDFLKAARPFIIASIIAVVASWGLVATKGLNFGIDFAGGTEALLGFNEPVDVGDLREAVAGTGLEKPEVVTYGLRDEGRYFIRSRTQSLLDPQELAKMREVVEKTAGKPEVWDTRDEAGEVIRARFAAAPDEAALEKALADAGFAGIDVRPESGGANPVYVIDVPGVREQLTQAMKERYGEKFKGIERLESVGEAVGEQMRNQGILAVLYALIGILLYVSFRFDLRYSPGAVAALAHDVSITVGLFSLLGLEFSLPIIAALLAIVGYSLNDTIVIYDRIRENLGLGVGKNLEETINLSVSESLSRTVVTSLTTLVAVLAIYIFGGGIIQNFAFAMLVGVIVGTYSSIYIASPIVVGLDRYFSNRASGAGGSERRRVAAGAGRP